MTTTCAARFATFAAPLLGSSVPSLNSASAPCRLAVTKRTSRPGSGALRGLRLTRAQTSSDHERRGPHEARCFSFSTDQTLRIEHKETQTSAVDIMKRNGAVRTEGLTSSE
jgi:hypothetical protein